MSGRGRQSPIEQGELKPSPDRHKKKKSKKSKKSHQMAPEAKVHVKTADEDEDDVQIIEAGDHGEEEGGSLTIKPPPLAVSRHREKGHKHKKDKHKSKDAGKDRGRPERTEFPREKTKDYNIPIRDARDAREIVKERKKEREMKEKEIAKEMKEREARKREESIKERERLERMELERRRERQMREDAVKEKQQARQQKRKEDRRPFPDSRRDKSRRGDHPPDDHRSRSRDQDRSRERGPNRPFPPPPRLQEDKAIKREMVEKLSPPSKSPVIKSESKEFVSPPQDTRMVVVEKEEKVKLSDSEGVAGKVKKDLKAEEEEEKDAESNNSESDSEDSDSDSSSEEEDDSSEEEEEEDVAEKDVEDNDVTVEEEGSSEVSHPVKLRSKFDDHSDAESPKTGHSEHSSPDQYMPDSPDLSDMEIRPEDSLPPYLPAIQGCRSVEEFNCLNRIEEGTYGVVYRALDKKTNEIVALKRLKMEKEREGFPITSLREINTLLKAQHENIVTVREIVVGSNMDKIYIVMDFVEHDLKSLMECMKNPFLVGEVKTLMRQLLRAVRHLHDNWILHRDLKTSNLLLSHQGILKVGDFGLAREYGSPLRHYTPVVVTLWYRAPELLLGVKEYSTPIDMWSVGCIFAEFLLMKALWPGKSEIDQINRIFKDLGTPNEIIWPGMMELPGCKRVTFNNHQYNVVRNRFGPYFTDLGFDLMNKMFTYDPSKRIITEDALRHEYFTESPLPVDPSMFPTWPARSEEGRRHANSPKPPSGGKAYQKLMDDEENLASSGFHMPSAAKGVSAQGMGFALKF